MAKPVERPGGKKLTKFTHRLNKTVYLARAAVLRLGRGDPEADGIAAFGFKRSTAGAGRWRSYGRNPPVPEPLWRADIKAGRHLRCGNA